MVEVIVKAVDPQGRISIPARWRRGWKSDKVALIKRGGRIELVPMESAPPSSLFDSIEIRGEVDFTDPHSIKRALMELQEH